MYCVIIQDRRHNLFMLYGTNNNAIQIWIPYMLTPLLISIHSYALMNWILYKTYFQGSMQNDSKYCYLANMLLRHNVFPCINNFIFVFKGFTYIQLDRMQTQKIVSFLANISCSQNVPSNIRLVFGLFHVFCILALARQLPGHIV